MERWVFWGEEIPIGKFFERTNVSALPAVERALNAGPLLDGNTRIPPDVVQSFIDELT